MTPVDKVERVIGCVSYVNRAGLPMDSGMVEATILLVWWKFNESEVFETEPSCLLSCYVVL